MMKCTHCGFDNPDNSKFCVNCGGKFESAAVQTQPYTAPQAQQLTQQTQQPMQGWQQPNTMRCPHCGGFNIDVQVMQENTGSVTVTKGKSKYKEQGHGCLWWLFIGWWWWIVDLFLWIYLFIPRLIVQLFKKRKYKGKTKSVATTKNTVAYKSIYLCKSCGYNWQK